MTGIVNSVYGFIVEVEHLCPRFDKYQCLYPLNFLEIKKIGRKGLLGEIEKMAIPKEGKRKCRDCPESGGFESTKFVTLPNTLIVYLDQMDDKGKFTNLHHQSMYPQNLDLEKCIHKDHVDKMKHKSKYNLCGIIAYTKGNYYVCLKKKSKVITETREWIVSTRKSSRRVSHEELFQDKVRAQVLLYK